jgi:RimJ/RimL family protein N-acetyltransferase
VRHNIHIEGFAYSLRPVGIEDAEFIVEIRSPERSRFMHQIDRSIEAQREWLEKYFLRPNEYYFVVERKKDGRREGLACLLNVDVENHSAESGRMILRPASLAATETALCLLRFAFDTFAIHEVWGIALQENKRILAFNQRLGFERREIVPVQIDGKTHRGIRCVLTRDRWTAFEKEVTEIARTIADRFASDRRGGQRNTPDQHSE